MNRPNRVTVAEVELCKIRKDVSSHNLLVTFSGKVCVICPSSSLSCVYKWDSLCPFIMFHTLVLWWKVASAPCSSMFNVMIVGSLFILKSLFLVWQQFVSRRHLGRPIETWSVGLANGFAKLLKQCFVGWHFALVQGWCQQEQAPIKLNAPMDVQWHHRWNWWVLRVLAPLLMRLSVLHSHHIDWTACLGDQSIPWRRIKSKQSTRCRLKQRTLLCPSSLNTCCRRISKSVFSSRTLNVQLLLLV